MATFERRVRVVNRVDELIKTLEGAFDESAIDSTLEESVRVEAARFQNILRQVAPKGQVEPAIRDHYSGYTRGESRPSIRQHGITLEQGWQQPQVIRTRKGVFFRLINTAPHMKILLAGAQKHKIPLNIFGNFRLFFWWGAPLRWPAKDGDDPGGRLLFGVNHPGFKKLNFVENALRRKEGRETIKDNFSRTFRQLINPLGTFFNK